MLGQATPQQTPQQKLPSLSSMSNGATAAFRHMLQIGLHGACIASRGSHGLQRAFRGSLKLLSRGRVLGAYICSGVINSGHENTVPYSGCSASLSNRLRLGGNCATNFGQGSAGRHAKYVIYLSIYLSLWSLILLILLVLNPDTRGGRQPDTHTT